LLPTLDSISEHRPRQGERGLGRQADRSRGKRPATERIRDDCACEPLTAPVAHATHGAEAAWWGGIWRRIKEHKIVQWTAAYAAFAFVALHVATLVSDAYEWPHVVVRTVILVLTIGFPIVPILAWYHGVRALKRVSGSELIIIALLLVIGGSLLWLFPHPTAERARTETPSPPATINPRPPSSAEIFAPAAALQSQCCRL
jgi:hypothetical protein